MLALSFRLLLQLASFRELSAGVKTLTLCLRGHYCPTGTGSAIPPCPKGSYGPDLGLHSSSQCKPCAGGYYCDSLGAITLNSTLAGQCAASFFCLLSVDVSTPWNSSVPCRLLLPCSTSTAQPCLACTYSPSLGLVNQSQGLTCSPGSYCSQMGLSAVSGLCAAGFYCTSRALAANPNYGSSYSGPCPMGHYCTAGTAVPLGCASGSYSQQTGLSSFPTCPAGYY